MKRAFSFSRPRHLFSLLLSLLAATSPAIAQAPASSFGGDLWTRPKLTGDWGGVRDQWAAKGFTIDLDTVYTLQGVASGGLPGTSNDLGNTVNNNLVFNLDTGKAGFWPGGFLKLRLENRAGDSVIGKAGSLSPVDSAVLFPSSTGNADKSVLGLTELTYMQFFSPKFGVIGGLINGLDADDNAIAGDLRRNETFFNASFLASLVEIANAPNASLGGGVIFLPTPSVTGELLAFGTEETATRNPFDNWDGTTIATQWTFKHSLANAPGGQTVGFLDSIGRTRTDIFQDPRIFLRNLVAARSVPTADKNSWALYYNAYQYIAGDERRGWGPFLRAGLSDGDPNPVKWNIAAGLGGRGTFAGRDGDRWGIGFYHLGMSDKGLLGAADIGDESGGELFYNVALTPAVHATLDSQWVSSGRPRQQTAWVLGARLQLGF